MTAVAMRMKGHKSGMKSFFAGDFAAAIAIFQATLKEFGSHVGLLSDLSAAYYLDGQIYEAQKISQRIEKELSQCEHLLSDVAHVNTLIFISKMREENGEVIPALKFLEKALSLNIEDSSLRMKVVCQIVRISAVLGLKENLAGFYRELITFSEDKSHWDIEIQHALMLAENCLLGPASMQSRYEALMAMPLSMADRRLIVFDFAEVALTTSQVSQSLKNHINPFSKTDLDIFERTLQAMVQEDYKPFSLAEIQPLSKQLSLMGYLRVLVLNIQKNPNQDEITALRRQMHFLLETVDNESRNVLQKKWLDESAKGLSSHVLVEVQDAAGSLVISDKQYSFIKKKGSWTILSSLKGNEAVSLQDISEKLGCVEYDESAYNRVRVAVQRLNKEIKEITGLSQALRIQSHQLICQGIKII